MPILSGRSVDIYYFGNNAQGLPDIADVGGGGNSTLALNMAPGALTADLVSGTGFVTGDIVAVGGVLNYELLRVLSVSVNEITWDTNNLPQNQHLAGEVAVEKDIEQLKAYKIDSVRTITPSSELAIAQSQALAGLPVLSAFRPGNYTNSLNMVAELNIDNSGIFLLAPNADNYNSQGDDAVVPATTTTDGATVAGAATFDVQAGLGASYAPNDIVQIGADGAADVEVVVVLSIATDTITITTADNPNGLRYAHTDLTNVNKILALGITHTIKTTATGLGGMNWIIKHSDSTVVTFIRNALCGTAAFGLDPGDLPLVTTDWVMRSAQISGVDIFSAFDSETLVHEPYAVWEIQPSFDNENLGTNFLRTLTLTKNVAISSNPIVGSQFPGNIGRGESSWEGSFTAEFEDLKFNNFVALGAEHRSRFLAGYSQDVNHSLDFDFEFSLYQGNKAPQVGGRDEITQDFSFLVKNNVATNTDGIVAYRTNTVNLKITRG